MLSSLLCQPNVHTKDGATEMILQTLETMRQQGRNKLLIITDFDMTLTRYYINGDRGCTSYGVIESSSLMPEPYTKEVLALKKKYSAIEVDPTYTEEERRVAMKAWYSRGHDLMIQYKLKKKDLQEMVSKARIKLRDGCETFFDILESNGIPLLIFSAGIADTLIRTIELQSSLRANVKVVSNYLEFDESGVATGFSEPTITSSNKGNSSEQFTALHREFKGRSNVILMGDSLNDPNMTGGMEDEPENLIKIGYLNHNVEQLLPIYYNLYDIILTGDGDFTPINQILECVLN